MSKEPKDFEITKLLELTDREKYAATVAAFEIIEKLDQLDIPKKYQNRKPSIRALAALSEKVVQFDFIDDETREKIEEELRESRRARSALDEVFSSAPMADDSEEDLDEIVDMEVSDEFVESADDEDDSDEDRDEDDESSSGDDDDEDEEEDTDRADSDEDEDDPEEEQDSSEEE